MATVASLLTDIGYSLNRVISGTSEPSQAECVAWINQTLDWILQSCAEFGSELGRTTGSITCAESAITAITQASPGSVASASHGFVSNDVVTISGVAGMTEVNDTEFTITRVDDDNYTIGVDTSAYTAYSSGGNGYMAVYDDFATALYAVAVMVDRDGNNFSGWIEQTNSRPLLQLVTEAHKEQYQPGSTNEPTAFYLDGSNNIVFLDTPDDNYTIKIPYYTTQSVSATGDTVPLLNIFNSLIVESISTKYLYRTREDAGVEWNWFSFVKSRAERLLKLRKQVPIMVM